MVVEASKMPGNGKLVLTGQLGSVMKESATIALNWIRSHARQVCTSCYKFIFFILCVVEMQIIIHTAVELCTKIMVVHGGGLHPGIIITTMCVLTPQFAVVFGHTHTRRNVYSCHFRSNSM